MIDGDGVHNAGITDGAVDNNKVANDANIAGSKLDINSVVPRSMDLQKRFLPRSYKWEIKPCKCIWESRKTYWMSTERH